MQGLVLFGRDQHPGQGRVAGAAVREEVETIAAVVEPVVGQHDVKGGRVKAGLGLGLAQHARDLAAPAREQCFQRLQHARVIVQAERPHAREPGARRGHPGAGGGGPGRLGPDLGQGNGEGAALARL